MQALKHIITKNTHLYLSATVDALELPNLEAARGLLSQLEMFDPATSASIKHICPNLLTTEDVSDLQNAVEGVFIKKALDAWVSRGSSEEKRLEAKTKFETYLADPTKTTLDLQNLGLKSLPNIFNAQKLKKTTSLYLDENKLEALPNSFANLTQLKELDLSENQLKAFPDSLGNLTQLTVLYCFKNKLEALPDSFGNLTQLKELSLRENQLKALPHSFGNLTQLTELYLRDNKLEALPDSFGNLTQLTKLSLRGNRLEFLPESFSKLTQLVHVELSNNPLVADFAQRNNWVIYLSIFVMLHHIKERILNSDYFIKWLNRETDQNRARDLARLILDNPMPFGIPDDHAHPLSAVALNVNICTQAPPDPKNPYVVFKKLEDSAKQETPSAPYQKGIKLNTKQIFVTARSTIPQAEILAVTEGRLLTGEVLRNLVTEFRTRIREAPNQAAIQAHIQSTNECSLELLLENLEDPFFLILLNEPIQAEIPLTQAMMFSLLKHFLDLSNEVPEGALVSPREASLCAISASIQNCSEGKSEGLTLTYALLDKKYRYSTESDINRIRKAKAFVRDTLQNAITNALSSDNRITRAMVGIRPRDAVSQLCHQAIYLKNLLGPHLGMPGSVKLDLSTHILYDTLITKPLQDVLTLFYTHFTVKTATDSLIKAFKRLPKTEKTPIFNGIVEMLGPLIGTEGLFDVDEETFEFSLTEKAALELLLVLGIGEKSPSPQRCCTIM